MKLKYRINSISHGRLLDKHFVLLLRHVLAKTRTRVAATRAIFHSRLQYSFQKKIVTWLHGVPAKFADRKIAEFSFFLQFFRNCCMPAQDKLHIKILMCDSNIIIS